MKRQLYYSIILTAVLAGCSAGDNGASKENRTGTNPGGQSTGIREQMVEVMELEQQMISRTIEYTSNLIPLEENHLAPSSPGRIEEIYVEIGDRVKRVTSWYKWTGLSCTKP